MKKILLLILIHALVLSPVYSQNKTGKGTKSSKTSKTAKSAKASKSTQVSKPKLIVGIVVDQMRYDYLYRFGKKFGPDGFLRLMNQGYNCKNVNYNYVPTYTGPGHASIYTGTTPATHGIVGNSWYDRTQKKSIYCAEDKSVQTIGAPGNAGQMSPRNLLATSICDEVHLASNQKSRVIGIALKDRGAILPAGHTANAAYWYDASGNWISSTYYMKQLPAWVDAFNKKNLAADYLSKPWNTLLPVEQYTESLEDNASYEFVYKGEKAPVFPHDMPSLMAANGGLDAIRGTPFGNSLTKDFALEAIRSENLGKGDNTDFLTISFSSTDYVGHAYGPRSVEVEDTYLRLDQDIAELLKFLDTWMGKENVLVFLTADHAVVDVPQLLMDEKIPSGYFEPHEAMDSLRKHLTRKYACSTLIMNYENQQIYLDHMEMNRRDIPEEVLEDDIAAFMLRFSGVASVVTARTLRNAYFGEEDSRSFVQKGYNIKRSGDVILTFEPGWIEAEKVSTTHGSAYSYDTHVPLLWYGWKVRSGVSNDPIHPIDIAPTISQMLDISLPDGSNGKPISGLLDILK